MKSKLVMVAITLAAFGRAQFIDNFDGNRLDSRWDLFSEHGNSWDATVSDGYQNGRRV